MVSPVEVLGVLLRSLGTAPNAVPPSLEERAGLWRSMTADRRVAVLLEDAVTAAQVRPLLPASPGSVVVVTSRSQLTGLRVGLAAAPVPVRPLDDDSAVMLLTAAVGQARAAAEPQAVRELATLCAGLPLALAVAGARLHRRPRLRLSAVVTELGDERRRLATLVVPDDISVQAVFDVSYRELAAPVARLYRALGLHPGREFSLAVAAAAVDADPDEVRSWLDVLTEGSLLEEVDEDRYRFHQLFWLHAAGRAVAEDTAQQRLAVQRRVIAWYLTHAAAADMRVMPQRWRVGRAYPIIAITPSEGDRDAALQWLERERTNLVGAVRLAADERLDVVAWQLCEALWSLFFRHKHHRNWLDTHEAGIDAARRCGDRLAEAKLRCQRGFAQLELGEFDAATDDFAQALVAARATADPQALSTALESLGLAALAVADFSTALTWLDQALVPAQQVNDRRALALLAHHRGRALSGMGRHDAARELLSDALARIRAVPDLYNEARVLTSRGEAELRAGDLAAATDALHQALAGMRAARVPFEQARIVVLLAAVAQEGGDTASARDHLKIALELYQALGAGQVADVAARLASIPATISDPPTQ